MEHLTRIKTLESRVAKLPITESDLCRLASAPQANLSRWRSPNGSPNLLKFQKQMTSLERVLVEQEISLRDYLNDLHPKTDPESGD